MPMLRLLFQHHLHLYVSSYFAVSCKFKWRSQLVLCIAMVKCSCVESNVDVNGETWSTLFRNGLMRARRTTKHKVFRHTFSLMLNLLIYIRMEYWIPCNSGSRRVFRIWERKNVLNSDVCFSSNCIRNEPNGSTDLDKIVYIYIFISFAHLNWSWCESELAKEKCRKIAHHCSHHINSLWFDRWKCGYSELCWHTQW